MPIYTEPVYFRANNDKIYGKPIVRLLRRLSLTDRRTVQADRYMRFSPVRA